MGGRKRGRETSMCGCLSHVAHWECSLQSRHVPWVRIELVILWFAAPCSMHWATPARARVFVRSVNLNAFGWAMHTLAILLLLCRSPPCVPLTLPIPPTGRPSHSAGSTISSFCLLCFRSSTSQVLAVSAALNSGLIFWECWKLSSVCVSPSLLFSSSGALFNLWISGMETRYWIMGLPQWGSFLIPQVLAALVFLWCLGTEWWWWSSSSWIYPAFGDCLQNVWLAVGAPFPEANLFISLTLSD